jgi:hypothetical protein
MRQYLCAHVDPRSCEPRCAASYTRQRSDEHAVAASASASASDHQHSSASAHTGPVSTTRSRLQEANYIAVHVHNADAE